MTITIIDNYYPAAHECHSNIDNVRCDICFELIVQSPREGATTMAKGNPFPKKMMAARSGGGKPPMAMAARRGTATPDTGDPSAPAFKKGGFVPFKKKGKGKK